MTGETSTLALCAAAMLAAMLSSGTSAQLFKWVDNEGRTHYSDRRPNDAGSTTVIRPVSGSLSVYTPDPALLRAVEEARDRVNRPAAVPEPTPQPYAAPASMPETRPRDPCPQGDCYAGYFPVFPVAPAYYRRRTVPLAQAQLPPGAIAGTVNSPGIIPGNTGSAPGLALQNPGGAARYGPLPLPHSAQSRFGAH